MTKEDISITYENNIFTYTKNGVKWISVDGEKWYGEEKRITELEKKIEELELELTVEKDQHQEEINLHLHAEDYIKALEQQIEKMKCGQNCKHLYINLCDLNFRTCSSCKDKWEIKE